MSATERSSAPEADGLTRGEQQIAAAFSRAREDGRRAAFMPYLMGGFPTTELSARIGEAYADNGADLVELGVPYSDPLADGPVVQGAGSAALRAGATFDGVLGVCERLAPRLPVVVMLYANVLHARGVADALGSIRDAGASGVIVPDLPLEEATEVRGACASSDLAMVPLVAPTTPPERAARIGALARGFLYCVSVTGTTGERGALADAFADVVARAKAATDVPVALGFGISTPDQAAQAADAGADGVIVGSRLVRAAAEADDPVAAVGELVSALVDGLRAGAGE